MQGDHAQRFSTRRKVLGLYVTLQDRNWSLPLGGDSCGFLVPELAKQMSFTKLSLLSGIIWAAWHSPLLLFADYNAGTSHGYAMGCFTVMIVATSFIFAWLRLKSKSLWPPAVLHASHNLFIQTVFDNLVRDTGKTLWYTTEFGVALATVTSAFAFYFWTKRREVERNFLISDG